MTPNQERLEFANTLRGLAAGLVVVAHTVIAYWDVGSRSFIAFMTNALPLSLETHPAPASISFANRLFDYTGIVPGSLGVAVFFLISGFVIPFSLRSDNTPAFLIGRFFRIMPVYAAGFTVTLVAIWWSGTFFDNPWPFTAKEVAIHYFPGLRDVLWSRPIDGISWTLEIEMKFYLIIALFAWLLRRCSMAIFIVPIALLLIAVSLHNISNSLLPYGGWYFLSLALPRSFVYISYMFCGVTFYYVLVGRITPRAALLPMIGLLSLFGATLKHIAPADFAAFASYVVALPIFALALKYRNFFNPGKLTGFLADISYPLYVVHSIAGYVLLRAMLDQGLSGFTATTIAILASIACAWLIHIAVENPARDLGKILSRAVGRLGRPVVPQHAIQPAAAQQPLAAAA